MSAGMEKRIDGALKRVQRESLPRRCSSGPWVAMFPDVWESGPHGLPCAPQAMQARCPLPSCPPPVDEFHEQAGSGMMSAQVSSHRFRS